MKNIQSLNRIVVLFLLVVFLSMPAFASVTGTVTDTIGSPVSGALVTFTEESNPDNEYSDYTDSEGRYELLISPVLVDRFQNNIVYG